MIKGYGVWDVDLVQNNNNKRTGILSDNTYIIYFSTINEASMFLRLQGTQRNSMWIIFKHQIQTSLTANPSTDDVENQHWVSCITFLLMLGLECTLNLIAQLPASILYRLEASLQHQPQSCGKDCKQRPVG